IRTLRRLGVSPVAVYSDADRHALHVAQSDTAVRLGPPPAAESYLQQAAILAAAKQTGAEAIHPGYGFLSENADFAAACEDAGIVFIGPSADSIRRLGSKTEARCLAKQAGIPVVPGTEASISGIDQALRSAREVGYPVLLKAA